MSGIPQAGNRLHRHHDHGLASQIFNHKKHRGLLKMQWAPVEIARVHRDKLMLFFARLLLRKFTMIAVFVVVVFDQMLTNKKVIRRSTVSEDRRVEANDHCHDRKEKQC